MGAIVPPNGERGKEAVDAREGLGASCVGASTSRLAMLADRATFGFSCLGASSRRLPSLTAGYHLVAAGVLSIQTNDLKDAKA